MTILGIRILIEGRTEDPIVHGARLCGLPEVVRPTPWLPQPGEGLGFSVLLLTTITRVVGRFFLYTYILTYTHIHISIYLSVHLSIYLAVHLSVYLHIHMGIHIDIHIAIHVEITGGLQTCWL